MIFVKTKETARIKNKLLHNSENIDEMVVHNEKENCLLFLSNYNNEICIQDIIYYKNIINEFDQIILSNDNYLNINGIFLNKNMIIRRSEGLTEYYNIFPNK